MGCELMGSHGGADEFFECCRGLAGAARIDAMTSNCAAGAGGGGAGIACNCGFVGGTEGPPYPATLVEAKGLPACPAMSPPEEPDWWRSVCSWLRSTWNVEHCRPSLDCVEASLSPARRRASTGAGSGFDERSGCQPALGGRAGGPCSKDGATSIFDRCWSKKSTPIDSARAISPTILSQRKRKCGRSGPHRET